MRGRQFLLSAPNLRLNEYGADCHAFFSQVLSLNVFGASRYTRTHATIE